MLQVNNIKVIYNDTALVLKGISIEVPEGGVVALLGSNGAGKTTTLKAIAGVLDVENGKLEEGTVEFRGQKIAYRDPEKAVKLGLSLVPEGRRVFDDLTVAENLWIGAHIRKDRDGVKKDFQMIMNYFPVLKKKEKQRALFLSGGEQQMLAIGRGLMPRPRLLMLDEPSLGLAPMLTKEIFTILRTINHDRATAILLVEQNASIALKFSKYGYIMENGKIVLDGLCQMLMNNEDVKEFYLGITEEDAEKSYADVKHYKRRKRWLS